MLEQQLPPIANSHPYKIQKLAFLQLGMAKPKTVYSSRSQSRSNSVQPSLNNSQSSPSKKKSVTSNETQRLKSAKKTLSTVCVDSTLLDSIRKIKQHKLEPDLSLIKQYSQRMLANNTRQNRLNLADLLQTLHPFFNKIHTHIGQAIILLGKPLIYYKGQLIFDTPEQKQQFPTIPKKGRTKEDIGFIIFGKLQLSNDKMFYDHSLTNGGTLFENKFIGRRDKINYYAEVCEPTMVMWLSRQSYYIIRKQCFLSMDLKYKFGEFQNLLKFNMVHKKLPDQPMF